MKFKSIIFLFVLTLALTKHSALAETMLQVPNSENTCMILITEDSPGGLSICFDAFSLDETKAETDSGTNFSATGLKSNDEISKEELIEKVAIETGQSEIDIANTLDGILNVITLALKNEKAVSLTGFGTFSVTRHPARTGINPRTGEEIAVKATKIPSFKAGKALKDAVN